MTNEVMPIADGVLDAGQPFCEVAAWAEVGRQQDGPGDRVDRVGGVGGVGSVVLAHGVLLILVAG